MADIIVNANLTTIDPNDGVAGKRAALFDTESYLATYADAKAARINPLDHHRLVGWKEGRDPSVNFDTTEYVSHYFDVPAASIDRCSISCERGSTRGARRLGMACGGRGRLPHTISR
jgi:hypothetical protein